MLCPNDQTPLTMSERQGIEIDFCPTCRGVWLDRGELDKIVERSVAAPVAAPPRQGFDASHQGYHKPYHKRRKSFFEELFD